MAKASKNKLKSQNFGSFLIVSVHPHTVVVNENIFRNTVLNYRGTAASGIKDNLFVTVRTSSSFGYEAQTMQHESKENASIVVRKDTTILSEDAVDFIKDHKGLGQKRNHH